MAEYIEREQAIGALIKGFAFHGYAGNTAVNIIKGIPSVDVCPYYIYNKHDRGDDSFCRKFNCEVSADVKPVIWRGCRGMDGIKYYDHNWNEIETPDESQKIEYVPVVHGEWIDYKDLPTYDDYYQCSICGVLSKGKFYFCSNCGADMRPKYGAEMGTDDG